MPSLRSLPRPVSVLGAIFAAWALGACQSASVPDPPPPPDDLTTAFVQASVWDGETFAPRDLFVRDGRFVDAPPGGAATVIDLAGHFIVPPYTEAHHHVTGADEATSRRFLEGGVFYALNANTVVGPFADRDDFFERHDTYDVRLAMGGVTEPGGHPEKLYVKTLTRYVYPDWTLDDFIGDAFHYAHTLEEFEQVLDTLQAQGSQIVKTYLLYSEDYAQRRDDPEFYGLKGLNPEIYAEFVKAAHDRDLPVAVHVETRHDMLVAARAGADLFVHLPAYGYWDDDPERYRLDEATVDAVKASGAAVVPTYSVAARRYGDGQNSEERDPHLALQRQNIQRLQAAGVPILAGTDGISASPVDEAVHLHTIGGLTRAQAVATLTDGASFLFPERRLSCFDTGCEADFLVLEGDPSADLEALRRIAHRIKGGQELSWPDDEESAPPQGG